MPGRFDASIQAAKEHIDLAQAHLDDIEAAMATLREAGMYPSVPTESWESRNGSDPIYLIMVFPKAPHPDYLSPTGKRKVYIGKKADKIANAQRLAYNRSAWETLGWKADKLTSHIGRMIIKAENLRNACKLWPHVPDLDTNYQPMPLLPISPHREKKGHGG